MVDVHKYVVKIKNSVDKVSAMFNQASRGLNRFKSIHV